jgi:uncharacterized protein
MTEIATRVARLDWPGITGELDQLGYATTPALLDADQCADMVELFEREDAFRSTVVMARHAFGEGTYRYFADPLPAPVQELREAFYPPLAALANDWAERLGDRAFAEQLDELLAQCAAAGQHQPTPLILRYEAGGYNCLHQDLYGEIAFPLQVTILLSKPDDFTGGENVFVEQRPRAQSRASVVGLELGHGVIFPVRARPVPGVRGFKRVIMRHGVSTVRAGERFALGIIFHNAK